MTKGGLFKTVSLIAFITIFSKLLGFTRDLVIASEYGASLASDAYFYAYQIPALALILLGGLGGPFHTATIAVFGKIFSKQKNQVLEADNKLLNTYIAFTFVSFSLLSILVGVFADPVMRFIAVGASPELQDLAAQLLVIMSPILIIGGVIGIFYGVLNVFGSYMIPSMSPIIASFVIIVSVLFAGSTYGVNVLAIATLAGAVGMLLIQLPHFFKFGFRIKPNLDHKQEGLKKIGELLFPAMIGTTIGQTNIYVDMFFVSGLQEGSWTAIVYANRLMQMPIGILITAMLVPIFPIFTSFVAENDIKSLIKYIYKAIVSLWIIAFPILVFILFFAVDGIQVLLERGEFNHNDTLMVANALFFLSFSIIPYMARDTVTRVFYAFDDAKTPLFVGIMAIIVNFIMDWLLVGPFGVGGITLSTTIVTTFNMVVLVILLRKKICQISLRNYIPVIVKVVLSCGIMALSCYILNLFWQLYIPTETIFVFFKLCIIATVSFAIYFITSLLLGIDESMMLLKKFSGRFIK